eukprot:TRINITY_DN9031_c0_g1_i1.p1 TRINITY_DN9031_c0_g1~~TRINITY_DN9031_c0_g1_i1.p1  ORF type:complete len:400 (+),score=72.21 TRINITY_DN9031_c0_g1_i1:498-1697(+)
MEAHLRRWARQGQPGVPARIHVHAGSNEEVQGVEDVLWALYHGNQLSESITAARCIAALKAADELGAPHVMTAAQEWLVPDRIADRHAASSLYALSDTVLDNIPEAVKARACRMLLHGLYDLEATLADEKARRRMLDLPEEVLAALLSSDRTLVAQESTVASAAMMYADKQLRMDHVPDSLAHCLRLRRLSPAYAAAVASAFPRWSLRVLLMAAACHERAEVSNAVCRDDDQSLMAALGDLSTRRAPSSITSISLFIQLRLDEGTAAMAACALQDDESVTISTTDPIAYAGYEWRLQLQAAVADGHVSVAVYVMHTAYKDLCARVRTPYVKRSCVISCDALPGADAGPAISRTVTSAGFRALVYSNFFGVKMRAWDATKLRRWANEDGEIEIKAKVTVR